MRFLPETQTSTLRKEVRALKKAQKNGYSVGEIVTEIARVNSTGNEFADLSKALQQVEYLTGITEYKTVIADGVKGLKPKPKPASSSTLGDDTVLA
ncbi:hypothetical protein L9H26_18945 [Morganella psychrotolerans]|uniref:Uncharacterized protein n=1 Tax=Morganella psychrotolerans TaxID=368603 RepID=A0A5M9QX19_9GAMM|nr:hypothetical protein [Morganella psychrotolerans]KAA8712980.1 hypothetical protein F4V73_17845 [Morganella psychrotolerans]OBU01918.1 hypothetical protein AYY16_17065 [Morganella psychrotolerans]